MKYLPIYVSLVMCLVVKGYSEVIQCYVCDDCEGLDEKPLQSCPLEVTTTTTAPKTTDQPITSSEPPEPTVSTAHPPEPTVSTAQPPEPTVSTVQPPEPTVITEVPAEPPVITEVPAEPPVITEVPAEPPVITEVPAEPPVITEVPAEPPVITEVPAEPPVITEVPGEPPVITEVPGEPPVITEVPAEPPVIPAERNKVGERSFQLPKQPSSHIRSYRSVLRAGPTHHCYSLDTVVGGTRKVKKGCIEVPEDKAACELLKAELGASIENCKVCSTTKCNSSSGLKYSLITFLIAITIGFFCK